jgi:hypothetical protein
MPTRSDPSFSSKKKYEKFPKGPEVLFHEIRVSLIGMKNPQLLARFEAFMSLVQFFPHSTPTTPASTLNTTGQGTSTKISYHITSLTPLQTSFINPSSELSFIGDLTPILPEEMPPSDLFFSKKRRAIVKRESHQKDGVITKRQGMVYDGKDHDGLEFAKEVASSLGASAIANQWLVDNLTK